MTKQTNNQFRDDEIVIMTHWDKKAELPQENPGGGNGGQSDNGGNGDARITNKQLNYIVNLGRNLSLNSKDLDGEALNGLSRWIFQYFLPFPEQKQAFFLSWEDFFCKTDLTPKEVCP